jgi:hypothetical protein
VPADRSNIGMGRRRQGATEPDRNDDSNRSLERSIEEEPSEEGYERGKTAGARGDRPPHDPVKPGVADDVARARRTRRGGA